MLRAAYKVTILHQTDAANRLLSSQHAGNKKHLFWVKNHQLGVEGRPKKEKWTHSQTHLPFGGHEPVLSCRLLLLVTAEFSEMRK